MPACVTDWHTFTSLKHSRISPVKTGYKYKTVFKPFKDEGWEGVIFSLSNLSAYFTSGWQVDNKEYYILLTCG